MKIIQLELSNIKSYQSEAINFNNGINCILGLNGSGKSTIIESIGYVLFNYNQGTSNNLLRYNESKGSISITFEGKDENVYKIIRNIKPKNSTVKIIDNTNNQVLFENVSDVYTFVKKVLGIPKEKSLSKLFEEIIAVPQGSFVNAFLETPKYRKENFDKLFDLDIYKDISDNVKKIYDQVEKECIFNIEKEQSKYEGLLSNKEETKKEFETVVAKVESDKEKLDEIIQVFNEANKARIEVKEKIQI